MSRSFKMYIKIFIACIGICAVAVSLMWLSTKQPPSTQNILYTGDTTFDAYKKMEDTYVLIALKANPSDAIRALSEDSRTNPQVSAVCHDILHGIGRAAFEKYDTFQSAVAFQDPFCNSGYIHGLFEVYMKTNQDSLSGIGGLCKNITGLRKFDVWQCNHGIGHGFMYYTGGELNTALSHCSQYLPEGAVESCQNGAYMEVFNQEILNNEVALVDPKNPFQTCATSAENVDECYMYVPSYLSQTARMDFKDIFSECSKIEEKYQYACISGVGSEAMKRNMGDPGSVFNICRDSGSYANEASCVFGVVSMYLNQEGTDAGGEALCVRAPVQYQALCRGVVESERDFFE